MKNSIKITITIILMVLILFFIFMMFKVDKVSKENNKLNLGIKQSIIEEDNSLPNMNNYQTPEINEEYTNKIYNSVCHKNKK